MYVYPRNADLLEFVGTLMCLALSVLFCGVFVVLPVWVSKEGCSFVGKVLSVVTELSMPVLSTGMSLAFLINAE